MQDRTTEDQRLVAIQSLRQERARLLILDYAVRRLLSSDQPLRAAHFTQIDGAHLFLGLVKETLYSETLRSCDCLHNIGRYWDLRWRKEAPHKPFGGLILDILKVLGRPVTADELAALVTPSRPEQAEDLADAIEQFLERRVGESVFRTEEDRYGRLDWIPDIIGRSLDDAVQVEFWGREFFGHWLTDQVFSLVSSSDQPLTASALVTTAGFPLSHRELLFALWVPQRHLTDLVPLLESALKEEKIRVLALGYWITSELEEVLKAELVAQSESLRIAYRQKGRRRDKRGTKLLTLQPTFTLTEGDKRELIEWLKRQPQPATLDQILEQVLEIVPGDPEYDGGRQALETELRSDDLFAFLGDSYWCLKEAIPQEVQQVPPSLIPETPQKPRELKGLFDLNLPLEALDEDLRQMMVSPRYEDVGERFAPTPATPTRVRRIEMAVTYPHLQEGTWVIPSDEIAFFDESAKIQFAVVQDPNGQSLPLWINLREGLIFGLKDWFQDQKIEVGSVLRLDRSKDGWLTIRKVRRDPYLFRPKERCNELVQFARHPSARQTPVVVLLQAVLSQYPSGLHFLTIWSELNIIRRISKLTIASLLCAYPMFSRLPEKSSHWVLDLTKVTAGIRPEIARYL
ncbi:MAG: DUF4777 domain-containing protein [Armatimonadetes bacterium]|nr:DUF4777 domain-containing protein [Armatimonadota bacterium]MDW8122352.1 hypothetical protein [Armatimonadota bacterium]